jgi:hypothetical protein
MSVIFLALGWVKILNVSLMNTQLPEALLVDIKKLIEESRQQVAIAVNSAPTLLANGQTH